MDTAPLHASNSMLAQLERWAWSSHNSADLSTRFVTAVRNAEQTAPAAELELPAEVPETQAERLRLGRWQHVFELAAQLRACEPEPHPTLVEDALARAELAASRLGLGGL